MDDLDSLDASLQCTLFREDHLQMKNKPNQGRKYAGLENKHSQRANFENTPSECSTVFLYAPLRTPIYSNFEIYSLR